MKVALGCLMVVSWVTLAGCGQPACDGVDCGHEQDQGHVHHTAHPVAGPHHGQLVELGKDEYHAELVRDESPSTITMYLLDSLAQVSVPIEAANITINLTRGGRGEQFLLSALAEPGDPPGKTSRFVSTDAELAEDLQQGAKAQLVVYIKDRQYRGEIHHGHDHGEGHHHEGDDALVWIRPDIQHGTYLISLGHHGKTLHAGEPVEPAVSITHNGAPVSDALVYHSLWSGDGAILLGDEQPTVYEPPTSEEPAHYAQGELSIPNDAKVVIIRYRIVLPTGVGELSYDVVLSMVQ